MTFRTNEHIQSWLKSKTETDCDGGFFDAMNYIDNLEGIIIKNSNLRIDAENYSSKLQSENQSLKAELRRERECVDTSLKELAQYENISFYVWIQSNPNCIPSEKAENYLKLARQTQALRKIKMEN